MPWIRIPCHAYRSDYLMRFLEKPSREICYRMVDCSGNFLDAVGISNAWVVPDSLIVDLRDYIHPDIHNLIPHVIDPGQLKVYRDTADFCNQLELPLSHQVDMYSFCRVNPLIVSFPSTDLRLRFCEESAKYFRTDCAILLNRIVSQFVRFYRFHLALDSMPSFDIIFNARYGEEGIDWSFRVASNDEEITDDPYDPVRVVQEGRQYTHRMLSDLYSDSEWLFMKQTSDALKHPNAPDADVFTYETTSRLRFLSYESFWEL